jgi:hypothetical protein
MKVKEAIFNGRDISETLVKPAITSLKKNKDNATIKQGVSDTINALPMCLSDIIGLCIKVLTTPIPDITWANVYTITNAATTPKSSDVRNLAVIINITKRTSFEDMVNKAITLRLE